MALIEGCKHELELTIPAGDVQQETDRVTLNYQKKAHLKGFRPGKAPLGVIKSSYATNIRQDVLETLIPKALDKKFEEEKLQVVGQPEVKDLHYHDGQDVHFKVAFEVAPKIELGDYRNLEVPYAEPAVADADLDQEITSLRESKAEFVNLDPRPAVSGDFVRLAIESTGGVAEPVKSDDLSLELGSADTLPEFTEGIAGMAPGDEKDLTVTYPEDYGSPNLQGKTVAFHVQLKQIQRKELPELNDEFAKDVGDYQSLDELKAAIRNQIFRERERTAQDEAKSKIIDQLIERHEFPVPDAYVEMQLRSGLERMLRQLSMQGADLSQLKLDPERFRESQKPQATKDVKASLLIEEIANRESIEAMQDEVDRELQVASRRERQPVAALRQQWEKDGTLRRVAGHIRTAKTLSFLFENARKVAPQPAVEEAAQPTE